MKRLTSLYREILSERKMHEVITPHDIHPHQIDDLETKFIPRASQTGQFDQNTVKTVLSHLRGLTKTPDQIPLALKNLQSKQAAEFDKFLTATKAWTDEYAATGNAAVDYLSDLMTRIKHNQPLLDKRPERDPKW